MKKNHYAMVSMLSRAWKHKMLFIMRLTFSICLFCVLQSFAIGTFSQNTRLSINQKNVSVESVLQLIEDKTDYYFMYSALVVDITRTVDVEATNKLVPEILEDIFKGTDTSYKIDGRLVALTKNDEISQVSQQKKSVSGKVTDSSGAPLPGVTVVVKGSTQGMITDANGNYSMSQVPENATLQFSFVGMKTQYIAISGKTTINTVLQEETVGIEEVVAVGYGTVRKSDLTGSLGNVKEAQLKNSPAASVAQQLSGKISGVQVNSNSGRPGGRTNVRIRGFSSINSSNNPLYVVDGIAMPMSNQAFGTQAIDYINPSDIVSVEVLKDASSTAIYGSRGANGVILITTKKGETSTNSKITYETTVGMNTIGPKRTHVLNSEQFLAVQDLAYKNIEKYDPAGWASGKYASLDPSLRKSNPLLFDKNGNPLYNTDWLKECVQNNLSQNHQMSLSGGSATTAYSVELGYRDDQGLLLNSYLKRYSAKVTFDDQIKKWLKVGGSLSYNDQTQNIVDHDWQVMRNLTESLPIEPVRYSDGSYSLSTDYPNVEMFFNPVRILNERKLIVNSQTTLGNLYSNINFTKDLEMHTLLGANILNNGINKSEGKAIAPWGPNGDASVDNSKEKFWSFENYLTYNKKIGLDHAIKAMAGVSWQETNYFASGVSIGNFSTDYFTFNNLSAGSNVQSYSSVASRFALHSYFSRINYTLKDKYLLTVTDRIDGSSKFGTNNKYANFPSAALAWRASNESFLKDNKVISNLKVRTSYGLTGNSEIPSYTSIGLLNSGYAAIYNNTKVGGTGIGRLENPNLKWEKTSQSDFGVEIGLLQNKISIEADVYYRKTTDMLLDAPVPTTSGYATMRENVGSMENKGIEFSLNTNNISNKDFSWTTNFTLSMNRNKVLSLATPSDIFGVGGPGFTNQTNIIRVGEPVGSFWGLVRLGTWSTAEATEAAKFTSYRGGGTMLPGDIKYLDVNGDHVINDADRMIIGNGSPKAFGGFRNNFQYKNWDVVLELQYSYGNDVLDMTHHPSEDRQGLANSYISVLDAWTPQHQNTMIAEIRDTRAGYVTNVDTRWVQDGSFIRGKNLILGYTFPSSIINKLGLSKLRATFSAQNFFLLTKYTSGDPEVTLNTFADGNLVFAQGMNFHDYPRPTTYMLGLQVTF